MFVPSYVYLCWHKFILMSVCTCTAKIRVRSYSINKKYKLKTYLIKHYIMKFSTSLVQSLSRVQLFVTQRTAACQAPLSITSSQSLLKLMSIESVMPSSHLILCCPLLLLPSIFRRIRVFPSESVLCIRWPKYCSFVFSISPSNKHPGLISFGMDWLDLPAVQGTQESSPTPQFKSIRSSALSFLYGPTLTSIHDHWKNRSFD